MILEKINSDLKEAMKASEEAKVLTLRFLLSAIHNKEIALRVENLSDEDVVEVIRQQVKQRKESIAAFAAGGRDDLVRKEQSEIEILNRYLPQQISEEELAKVVEEVVRKTGAKTLSDFGRVMGAVMAKVKGRVEGQMAAEIVKKILSRQH